jgi:hypothetical protein
MVASAFRNKLPSVKIEGRQLSFESLFFGVIPAPEVGALSE